MEPSRIVVVGTPEFVIGFRLAGVKDTIAVSTDDIERTVLGLFEKESTGIVVLNYSDIQNIHPKVRERLWQSTKPVMVAIGSDPQNDLREKIRRTIVVDLYK
jgi:V/A-type H+-transporting ATPase subunit F